jgi:hypothetical protein
MVPRTPKNHPGRVEVPPLEFSRQYAIGTIHVTIDMRDPQGTMGVIEFDQTNRVIRIRLNADHPGIRGAAAAMDEMALNYYAAELCFRGTERMRRVTGKWPWPYRHWPEFLSACGYLGRRILPSGTRAPTIG